MTFSLVKIRESGNISVNEKRLLRAESSKAIDLSAVFIVPKMYRLLGTPKGFLLYGSVTCFGCSPLS